MGGLKVPKDVGAKSLGASKQKEAERFWDTGPAVRERLSQMCIPEDPVPPQTPEPPRIKPGSLGTLPPAEFSALHENCVAWAGFYSECLAMLRGRILRYDNEMKDVEVLTKEKAIKAARAAGEKAPSAEKLNVMVRTEPRWRELKVAHQEETELLYRAQAVHEHMENQRGLVSRHIELRKLNMAGHQENGNINERGRAARNPVTGRRRQGL